MCSSDVRPTLQAAGTGHRPPYPLCQDVTGYNSIQQRTNTSACEFKTQPRHLSPHAPREIAAQHRPYTALLSPDCCCSLNIFTVSRYLAVRLALLIQQGATRCLWKHLAGEASRLLVGEQRI